MVQVLPVRLTQEVEEGVREASIHQPTAHRVVQVSLSLDTDRLKMAAVVLAAAFLQRRHVTVNC